jgi:hypothetical protein
MTTTSVHVQSYVERDYADVFTPAVAAAIAALAPLDRDRKALMQARIERRARASRPSRARRRAHRLPRSERDDRPHEDQGERRT